MEIKAVTKYNFKGKEYFTLKEIKEDIQNTIGLEVLDKIVRVCPPQKHKDLFNLLDVLCSPNVRKVLMECLNVTFDSEPEFFGEEVETINVLDIK
jgi:hypothetical protein